MTVQIAQLIGGAGTGKTRELMACLDLALKQLHDPFSVGYVSFTRAACDEAATRAANQLDMPFGALRDEGWFKTLHGICYRALGVKGELVTDCAADRKWLEEALGVKATAPVVPGEDSEYEASDDGDAGRALQLWHACRNRLEPLRPTWETADYCDDQTPTYERCVEIITLYEQAKRLDHRLDFVDLLGRFAGYRFRPEGAEQCEPDGDVPGLKCWIEDEAQDSSACLDACFQRLISAPSVKYVYRGADPFQAIFQWAGSDPRFFLDQPHAKRRVMPKSWRCPANILRLGEDILRDCSDYWDRGIAPRGPGGEVEERDWGDGWADDLDPRESWLLMARTNFQVGRIARRLDAAGVPWMPTQRDRGSRWRAPRRNAAIKALMALEAKGPIDGREWRAVLDNVPSKSGGEELLVRGTKADWGALSDDEALDRAMFVLPDGLGELGATPAFIAAVKAGRWREWVEHADAYAVAVARWGEEAVEKPQIRLGTVHSAKGMEATNVAVLTTISAPCARATETVKGMDEELRVKYVSVTRAKEKLVVLSENRTRFRWKLPV